MPSAPLRRAVLLWLIVLRPLKAVDGASGGLVEAEALLGGEKAVAFVTRPFRLGFLRSNADSDCAVGVLLVPVQDINVILGCLHKDAGGCDLFDTVLPLVGLCAGNLDN